MVDKVEKIWMDGEIVAWDDAKVHILTHSLHYGLGAFEGIRAYKSRRRLDFRLPAAGARRPPARLVQALLHRSLAGRTTSSSRRASSCFASTRWTRPTSDR